MAAMEQLSPRRQRAARIRIGAAVASGLGFGVAVAGFAVHDHGASTTTVATTGSATVTTPTTEAPTFDDQFGSDFGATPGVGNSRPDSTSRGS
jgi:hypothetical protein